MEDEMIRELCDEDECTRETECCSLDGKVVVVGRAVSLLALVAGRRKLQVLAPSPLAYPSFGGGDVDLERFAI
jgi:hypothetical protein